MMDAYGPSPAARRYASPQVVNRGKMSTGSNLGNLGVMGGGGSGKLGGNSKPRASSASLTRRSNSPAAALANSGNFTFQPYQRSSFDGELNNGARNNAYGSYGAPYQLASGGGGVGAGVGGNGFVNDSYDQLRRNYELSRNGAVNATTLLGSGGGALVPRAQSASQYRSNGGNSGNTGTSFANSGYTGSSAYLSLRQQQSAALGYANGTGAGDGASLLEGGINALFPSSSMRAGGGGLNRLGMNNTRGIASGGNYYYGSNTAGSGLLGLSTAEAQRMVANSSTEIIPANYVLKPILAPRSSVTSVPKGTAGQGTGRRVTFSTPLTSHTPLANPFMFQNVAAVLPQGPQQQQQQGSALSPSSTGNSAASAALTAQRGAQTAQGPGTTNPLSAGGVYGPLPNMGATSNTPGLQRPASATAVLNGSHVSFANTNNSNSNSGSPTTNSNNSNNSYNMSSYNAPNVPGGAVLTGGTAANTSRSSSPVTVGSPIPSGGFFNAGAGASGTSTTTTSSSSSAGIIGLGIASAGKPPLFVSTAPAAGSASATPYLDAATTGQQLSPVPNSGASTPSSSGSSVSGGSSGPGPGGPGAGGSIIRPAPVLGNRAQQRPSSADIHLGAAGAVVPTPAVLAPLLAFVSGPGSDGGMVAPSPRTAAAVGGALPLIRTQSPSLPPTANATTTNTAGSGTTTSTINVNSSYTPIFNQVPSPGRPPSGPNRGMVLSNSTENLASIAQIKEDHGSSNTLLKSALQGKAQRPGSANIALATASADSASGSGASGGVGGSLPRKGSMDSLAEMTFTRMTAPVRTASGTKALSTIGDATAAGGTGPWGELRRDSNASSIEDSLADSARGSSRGGRNRRTPQRPSLAEQLAHISAESHVPSAKTTDELTSASQDSQPSFFSQSLNSAIAVGRSSSTSPVPSDFADGRITPDIMTQPTVPPSPNNTLYALPAKVFSIGSQSCRQPSRVCFYCDRAEYTFYPPTPSDSTALSLVLYYTDMSAISTVGTKLRFKISARAVQELVDDAALNSLLLVSVELTSSASMAIVRDRIIPLINQAKS